MPLLLTLKSIYLLSIVFLVGFEHVIQPCKILYNKNYQIKAKQRIQLTL